MVTLYAVKFSDEWPDEFLKSHIMNQPISEREKILKYRQKKDRIQSLVGIMLIKYIIAEHLGVQPSLIVINRDKYGRPYCSMTQWKGDFNLSHSGEWVILSISEKCKVGVDIEKMNNISMEITNYFLTEKEQRNLYNGKGNDLIKDFYKLWTLKESYVKLIGLGLSYPLNSFEFEIKTKEECQELIKVHDYNNNLEAVYFKIYNDLEGYTLALCSNTKKLPSKIEIINLETIFE